MSAKVQEAHEHCKAAEKHLKTSLLRWKPDYDSAADEYSQAAQCFRIARQLKNSKECHLKASEYYTKNRAFFHAAKSLENAILVNKEETLPDEIYSLALESSNLYQQHGSGDSGANVLDKAAKILEANHPEKAYKLYQMASEVSSAEGSSHQGIEYTSKATRLLVKLRMFDQAADSVRREIGYHLEANNFGAVGRLTVAAVLIQLARGDVVAAEKSYKEWGSNCEAAESETLESLLTAYDEEDREGAKRALSSPFIRSMDVEYARLAASVDLPKGEPIPSVGVRKNAAPSYVSVQSDAPAAHAPAHAPAAAAHAPAAAAHAPAAAAHAPAAAASFQPSATVTQHPSRFEDIEESPYEAVTGAKDASDGEEEGGFC